MYCLSKTEQRKLEALRRGDPLVDNTLGQLDRLLASKIFGNVRQTKRDFLGFVAGKMLIGQAEEITEKLVAIRVWKDTNFNPWEYSKVRMAAKDLRKKIAKYYRTEGQSDSVEIRLPDWGYVPEIRDRRRSIEVALFENRNPDGDQQSLCVAVSDEIVHRLATGGAIEAKRVERLGSGTSGAHYGLCGSVGCRNDNTIKLEICLQDLRARQIIWDATREGRRDEALRLSQGIADDVLSLLRSETANSFPKSSRRSRFR